MQGKFITIEGIEGSGKSSQVTFMLDYFNQNRIDAIYIREPGSVALSEQIRNIILDDKYKDMEPLTEALLFIAARAENVAKVIKPALDSGKWVICDRFIDSTYVYQSLLKGVDYEFIKSLHNAVLQGVFPDHTFILDLPVEIAQQRLTYRQDNNRFDTMSIDHHQKIRDGYLKIASLNSDRIKVIDATPYAIQVHLDMRKYLNAIYINRNRKGESIWRK